MPYRLVKGSFHLYYQSDADRHVGSQPDGDSVWFEPNRPSLLSNLGGRSAKFNKGGFVQLRFEGIDSLELHYKGSQQEDRGARAARDFTLTELGFERVDYSGDTEMHAKDATPHPVSGYILTRTIDPFGRPVSFVFAGSTNKTDGDSNVFLDVPLLNNSINAKSVSAGHAFPTFYTGLPTDLRDRIGVLAAGASGKGIWPRDLSRSGFTARRTSDLEGLVIWPKLFRRLVSFFGSGTKSLSGLDQWLRADPERDDSLWIISRAEFGNMHDVVDLTPGGRLRLTYDPADLIIVPR